ncbi:hypothetical protein BT63DRAFT_358471, partial [Microthyrium microscopicum]
KPEITITLNENNTNGEKIYSTFDPIEGSISIVSRTDTKFDNLEIAMTGVGKTFVDKLSSSSAMVGRSEAIHRFLKLIQPISDNDIPESRVLKAGKAYTFPFTFVVPQQLLPRSCSHSAISNHLREFHLMLPPSMGEKLGESLEPEQVKISYSIAVKLTRTKNSGKKSTIADGSRKIKIRPTTSEHPPLNTDDDRDFCLRKDKTLRKGLLKGKIGALVMEASQPKSFRLPAAHEPQHATTSVRVNLRFDPDTDDATPPRLQNISTKLKVGTFFATTTRQDFPKRASPVADLTSDSAWETLSLASFTVPAVEWTKHAATASISLSPRPESALSTFSSVSGVSCSGAPIAPSPSYHDGPFYTAHILVPLSLPTNKRFHPTFHTCLVSRVYVLQLALSLAGQTFAAPTTLRLPVQVSCAGTAAGMERQRLESVAEQAWAEAEEAMAPRYVGPTGTEMSQPQRTQSNHSLPPGYE